MMRTRKQGDQPEQRLRAVHLLAAAAILGLLVMPVAFAGVGEPVATKGVKVAKKLKKVKKRLAALEARIDRVGQVPASLPPSGPAGGDLTGDFPNPLIGANSVAGAEINEPGVPIPTAWAEVEDPDGISQPGGDPFAVAQEGVQDISDGDVGNEASGTHCYRLGFTPDLVLATLAFRQTTNPNAILRVHTPGGALCGPSYEVRLAAYDAVDLGPDDADVYIAFFQLD
jgi:hypothetical protein